MNSHTDIDGTYVPKYQLETHAEVAARIKRGRSTLCAMRDEDDARFDPTFPEPIPIGPLSNPYASICFAAHEIDEWIESRMAMRPGKQLCPRCTNATSDSSTENPSTSPVPINKPRRKASG